MALELKDYNSTTLPTWCPGCGNFAIHTALKKALIELNIEPSEALISFDIGCNGNGADTVGTYAFKGLHGRSIAVASGVHLANRKFTVIADIGDGGCFHEGLDHLVNAIKSNYDITILIHNNQNFALTTGQATVTTPKGKKMYAQPHGSPERNLDVDSFILNLHPTFFAKAYSGDPLQLTEIIKKGIQHKGCSVINISQSCPTYNKEMTPQWFKENIIKLDTLPEYSSNSMEAAKELLETANKTKKIYTGIIFQDTTIPTFYDNLHSRKGIISELAEEVKEYNIKELLKYTNS